MYSCDRFVMPEVGSRNRFDTFLLPLRFVFTFVFISRKHQSAMRPPVIRKPFFLLSVSADYTPPPSHILPAVPREICM